MRGGFLRTLLVRRIFVPVVVMFGLMAMTAKAAQACFFGCIYHFGYFTVADGEIYYYQGCWQYSEGGQTYVICYYSEVFN